MEKLTTLIVVPVIFFLIIWLLAMPITMYQIKRKEKEEGKEKISDNFWKNWEEDKEKRRKENLEILMSWPIQNYNESTCRNCEAPIYSMVIAQTMYWNHKYKPTKCREAFPRMQQNTYISQYHE